MASGDVNQYILMAIPWIKTIVWLVIGLGSIIGIGYYLFVVKRRRKWIANLYEQKADGRLHFAGKDIVVERKINKGKQLIYLLRRNRAEVIPPSWECVYRHRNKEYCEYIRVTEDDFRPAQRIIDPKFNNSKEKSNLIENIKDALFEIKSVGRKDVYDKYIYAPINNKLTYGIDFKAISYDLNQMRINTIDNRDKIYADKRDFLEKYGTYIAIGAIIILIIVVLYLSFDYSSNVISEAMGSAKTQLSMIEQMASKMGGTVPAS